MADRSSPFVIFALPRSRTAWLSTFLTFGGWVCQHDLVARLADTDKIGRALSLPKTGAADTGMAHGWKVVREYFPRARFVTVRRDQREVVQSLARVGIDKAWVDIDRLDAALDEIEGLPNTMRVDFDDLDDEDTIRALWDFCLDIPFSRDWWCELRDKNIQIDMAQRIDEARTNRSALAGLRQVAHGFSAT